MPHELQYEYADGNANRFIVLAASLEYIPVKPEESSSGVYDGGDAITVSITSDQFAMLQKLFDEAISNTEIHTEQRAKLTGVIIRKTSKRTDRVTIAAGSVELAALGTALRTLLSQ